MKLRNGPYSTWGWALFCGIRHPDQPQLYRNLRRVRVIPRFGLHLKCDKVWSTERRTPETIYRLKIWKGSCELDRTHKDSKIPKVSSINMLIKYYHGPLKLLFSTYSSLVHDKWLKYLVPENQQWDKATRTQSFQTKVNTDMVGDGLTFYI